MDKHDWTFTFLIIGLIVFMGGIAYHIIFNYHNWWDYDWIGTITAISGATVLIVSSITELIISVGSGVKQ